MSDVNVMEQQPAGGNPMKPSSGTYGENAERERLEQQLPLGGGPGAPEQPAGPVGRPAGLSSPFGMPATGAAPGGVPDVLLGPSDRPDVPVGSPLDIGVPGMFPGAVDASQKRLALLDMLTSHPDASPEVREWASIVRSKLIDQ
jgi:hypothetical protein